MCMKLNKVYVVSFSSFRQSNTQRKFLDYILSVEPEGLVAYGFSNKLSFCFRFTKHFYSRIMEWEINMVR